MQINIFSKSNEYIKKKIVLYIIKILKIKFKYIIALTCIKHFLYGINCTIIVQLYVSDKQLCSDHLFIMLEKKLNLFRSILKMS
jgi:hypothetical protein